MLVSVISRIARSAGPPPSAPGDGGGQGAGDWTPGTLDNGADLPVVKLDTAYAIAAQTGTVHTCTTSAQFDTAITNCARGDIIVLQSGTTFDKSTTRTFPAKSGTGWVYVVSSDVYNSLFPRAPGERVGPGDLGDMAVVRSTTANTPVFTFTAGASKPTHWRFVGVAVTSTADQMNALVYLNGNTATDANLVDSIVLDRCYLYGSPGTRNIRRGFQMDGTNCAAVDSYLGPFRDPSDADSQAILHLYAGAGHKVVNCYLAATGENWMSGGGSSPRTPSDIEFRFNYLEKYAAWEGVYGVKNLLEIKFAKRVLIEGNVLARNWVSGQSGHAIHIKSTSQTGNGDGTQYKTSHIVVRYNKVTEYQEPFRVMGATEDSHQSTDYVVIRDNWFTNKRSGDGRWYLFSTSSFGALNYCVCINNVIDSSDANVPGYTGLSGGLKGTSLTFEDNVLRTSSGGSGPVWADSLPNALNALNGCWTAYTFTKNAVFGSWSTGTVGSNTVSASGTWNGIFTDAVGGDFSIAAASAFKGCGTGGADPGPDVATLTSKTQYTVNGQRPAEI